METQAISVKRGMSDMKRGFDALPSTPEWVIADANQLLSAMGEKRLDAFHEVEIKLRTDGESRVPKDTYDRIMNKLCADDSYCLATVTRTIDLAYERVDDAQRIRLTYDAATGEFLRCIIKWAQMHRTWHSGCGLEYRFTRASERPVVPPGGGFDPEALVHSEDDAPVMDQYQLVSCRVKNRHSFTYRQGKAEPMPWQLDVTEIANQPGRYEVEAELQAAAFHMDAPDRVKSAQFLFWWIADVVGVDGQERQEATEMKKRRI